MATSNSNAFDVSVGIPTPLAAAAAQMAPGTWTTFTTGIVGAASLSAMIDAGGGHRITEYSDKMAWLSGRREIHFTGGGHLVNAKTIVYTDVDNTWHDLGTPPWHKPGDFFHAYQHNTAKGNSHYVLHFGSTTINVMDIPSGTWTAMNTSGVGLATDGAIGALEWFPTFGSGSLIIVDGNADGLYRWNGTSWSILAPVPPMGGLHNVGVYSPIKDLMYLGGGAGSQLLYTMSNTGKVTPRTNCPIPFGINATISTVDPVSGKLLAIGIDRSMNVYDPGTDSWTTDTPPPNGFWSTGLYQEGDVMGILAAPVYDYGVTMFITIAGPTIYLRKGR